MKLYSILFAIGPDRPGIVEEVSRCLHDNMANIEDSRMAAMGGQFTVTVLFSCMEERMTAIESQAQSLASSGITCYFHTADDPHAQKKGGALPLQIHIQAMDHPGIVKMIVEALHGYGANVESLETRITNAPFSLARRNAARVSAVSPDCEITITTSSLVITGLR